LDWINRFLQDGAYPFMVPVLKNFVLPMLRQWEQASVLKQVGLLTDSSLPVFGAETAQKVLDPAMP
jgi:hypothetical protein